MKIEYLILCLFAIFLNIASQYIFLLFISGPYSIETSILIGTTMTFFLRFYLEKNFIFFKDKFSFQTGSMLYMYFVSSVLATLIFWIFEYSFHLLFNTDFLRYVGAAIGLFVGFYVKYKIDRGLTFN